MASKRYDVIWNRIKKNKTATIRCRPAKVQTIINEVKKIKSAENTGRKDLELKGYGRLVVSVDTDSFSGPWAEITWKLLEPELAENL